MVKLISVVARRSDAMDDVLALLAPGQPLRDGLNRVLHAKRGALVVVGDSASVLSICSGGFLLDAEFSPQRLAELAKMDGAIIVTGDASRIARANVHLVPDPSVHTTETGTRHRTAERVARSLDIPVVSVSAAMSIVTVYRGDSRQVLQPTTSLMDRADQALRTLSRFKDRLELVTSNLSSLEVEDMVTLRDIAEVLQRAELVARLATDVSGYLVELGADGRMFRLQLHELMDGVEHDRGLLLRDYVAPGVDPERASTDLAELSSADLSDLRRVARVLGGESADLDAAVEPRGYRMLKRITGLSDQIVGRVVARFATLQKIMRATAGDLEEVDGVGRSRARVLKDGLARLTETSILERYS